MPPVIIPCLIACAAIAMPPRAPADYYRPTQEQVLSQGKPYCFDITTKRECKDEEKK